jgi:hypothetical protein
MNYLVQRTVSTGGNQQIHFACFRRKPSRISLFPSHAYVDAMPCYSLSDNCSPERVITGHFAVENQLNFSTLCLVFIPTDAAVRKGPARAVRLTLKPC